MVVCLVGLAVFIDRDGSRTEGDGTGRTGVVTPWDRSDVSPDGSSVTVHYWGGSPECHPPTLLLDRVSGTELIATMRIGFVPDKFCTADLRLLTVSASVSPSVSQTATIVDGARR
jgi:hypothetical protein